MGQRFAKPMLVFVHGIQVDLPLDWWIDWLTALRDAGVTCDVDVEPIVWEHDRAKRSGVRGWASDLLGNLTAFGSPRAHLKIRAGLAAAARRVERGGAFIVVAHSLGTVLAHQQLVGMGLHCDLFVTVGSPLWRADKKPHLYDPVEKPPGVRRWVNVYSRWWDWAVGRHPIAAADENWRASSTHGALKYLRCQPVRRLIASRIARAKEDAFLADAA